MRIGYFADGRWSHKALDRITETPQLQVAFIVGRFDNPDPVLKKYSQKLGVPFLLHPDVNSREFIESIQKYSADIHVSMSFDQILKADIIKSAPRGFINCHAGALPFYRGRNVLNWALINGETSFGVTVHYVDEGIDTGDIILQRFAEIKLTDDYASVLDKAIILCAETLHEALLMIEREQEKRIKQSSIHPVGFYCSRRIPGDEWLDWNWTSERIHNFVRAITLPGPGARTYLKEQEVAVLKTELIPDAPAYIGKPGEVVGRDDMGVVVKTGDRTIRVTKIADVSEDGTINEERIPTLSIGTRLGLDPWKELKKLEKRVARLEQIIANLNLG